MLLRSRAARYAISTCCFLALALSLHLQPAARAQAHAPTPTAAPLPAEAEPPMEQQATPSVLLPGLYLDEARAPLKIGTRAPDFTLSRCAFDPAHAQSPAIRLSSWLKSAKGNGSIVIFWAFWCDTWKDMTRDLNLLKPQLASMKLQVLAVAVDASQQPVSWRAFESGRIWWPVAIDASQSASEAWGVRRVPTTFVLDKSGVVRVVFEGFPGKGSFVRKVSSALKIHAPSNAEHR